MSIKDLFEMIQCQGVTPADTQLLLVGSSLSENYLNACTNMSAEDLTKIFYSLYSQNELFKVAVDALRLMIEADLKRDKLVVGTPVNTFADNAQAKKLIEDALSELGAISVIPNKKES